MTSTENITKLPQWAQDRIRVLEMRLREAQQSIAALESDGSPTNQGSNITYSYGLDTPKPLRKGTKVRFWLGPTPQDEIQVGFGNYGTLEVYASAAGIIVRPMAHNAVTLGLSP